MFDWLHWFTDHANSKIFALLWFFSAFIIIVVYVYTGKRRTQRLESYKYIPLEDDDADEPNRRKESRDEQREE